MEGPQAPAAHERVEESHVADEEAPDFNSVMHRASGLVRWLPFNMTIPRKSTYTEFPGAEAPDFVIKSNLSATTSKLAMPGGSTIPLSPLFSDVMGEVVVESGLKMIMSEEEYQQVSPIASSPLFDLGQTLLTVRDDLQARARGCGASRPCTWQSMFSCLSSTEPPRTPVRRPHVPASPISSSRDLSTPSPGLQMDPGAPRLQMDPGSAPMEVAPNTNGPGSATMEVAPDGSGSAPLEVAPDGSGSATPMEVAPTTNGPRCEIQMPDDSD